MYVDRKPKTAEWWHASVSRVAEVNLKEKKSPWEDTLAITVDATKDKWGKRHTTIRITIEEKEIEYLYNRLIQGRKNKLRKLKAMEKELVLHEKKLINYYVECSDDDEEKWFELMLDVSDIREKLEG